MFRKGEIFLNGDIGAFTYAFLVGLGSMALVEWTSPHQQCCMGQIGSELALPLAHTLAVRTTEAGDAIEYLYPDAEFAGLIVRVPRLYAAA